jgi:hypothetical protein
VKLDDKLRQAGTLRTPDPARGHPVEARMAFRHQAPAPWILLKDRANDCQIRVRARASQLDVQKDSPAASASASSFWRFLSLKSIPIPAPLLHARCTTRLTQRKCKARRQRFRRSERVSENRPARSRTKSHWRLEPW